MCGSRSEIWLRFSSLGLWDAGVQRPLLSVWRLAFQLQQHTREKKKCCKYLLVFHTNKVLLFIMFVFAAQANFVYECDFWISKVIPCVHFNYTHTYHPWLIIDQYWDICCQLCSRTCFFSCHNLKLVKKSTFMMDFKPSPLSYFAWALVALLLNVPLLWKHPNRFTTDEYLISFFNNFLSTRPFCWQWPRISVEVWWLQLWKGCHGYMGLLR